MTRCFICGEDNENVLESHHIVPRRHGGSDAQENRVTLCANCHRAIERLYDRRFYQTIKESLRRDLNEDVRGRIREELRDEVEDEVREQVEAEMREQQRIQASQRAGVRESAVECPYCKEPQHAMKNHVRLASGDGHGTSGEYPDDDQWIEALN